MSVWIIYEAQYSSWTPDFVDGLEVFATEGLALGRINELRRQEAEQSLSWALKEDPTYKAKTYEARIKDLLKGRIEPQWYDVGMVTDVYGVEVWTTRQRTVREEIALLKAQMANAVDSTTRNRDERVANLRAQLAGQKDFDQGDWNIMEKEVVG